MEGIKFEGELDPQLLDGLMEVKEPEGVDLFGDFDDFAGKLEKRTSEKKKTTEKKQNTNKQSTKNSDALGDTSSNKRTTDLIMIDPVNNQNI